MRLQLDRAVIAFRGCCAFLSVEVLQSHVQLVHQHDTNLTSVGSVVSAHAPSIPRPATHVRRPSTTTHRTASAASASSHDDEVASVNTNASTVKDDPLTLTRAGHEAASQSSCSQHSHVSSSRSQLPSSASRETQESRVDGMINVFDLIFMFACL
jgi:hypothetical protein